MTTARTYTALCCLLLPAFSACTDGQENRDLQPVVIGKIEDVRVREASGLARSQRHDNVFWTINDSGADEWVHAISPRGKRLGEFDLARSDNKDWEDLASFILDGTPYLLIADIGDNEAKHESRTLYVVEEPADRDSDQQIIDWKIDFQYASGPRDAESAAVDIDNERVLVLTKRDIPPILYELPLRPRAEGTLTATRLGAITSLPRPSRQDVEFAPKLNDWYWQPVGMDISDDNLAAVILTYRAVYYYQRLPDEDWLYALKGQPRRVGLGNLRNAEAIAFGARTRTAIITGESLHSPIIAIDFNEDSTE